MPHCRINDAELYYEDQGQGQETVLFCHGLLFNLRMFDAQVEALQSNYRCVRFDFRGQGSSEVTDDGYNLDSLTRDVITLIEHLQLGRVHLVGFSMGGFVGLRVALRRPDLLRSLTLINSSAEAELAKNLPRFRLLNFIARWFGLRAVVGRVLPLMFSRHLLDDPDRAETCRYWRRQLLANHRIGATRAVRGVIGREAVIDEIDKITIPTLIIAGDEDAATPRIHSQRMHSRIRTSRLLTLEKAGHTTPVEQPEAVNQALVEFLSEQSARDH